MKIKAKLLTLISILILSMTISVLIYVGFNNFTKKIEIEKNYLQIYRNTMTDSHSELFRFLLDSFEIKAQLKTFNQALERQTAAFKNLEKISLLPLVSEEIKTSIKNISNLEDYNSDGLNKFYSSTDELLGIVEGIMKTSDKFILNSLSAGISGYSDTDLTKLRFFIKAMKKDLFHLEVGYQTSIGIIDSQYEIIDSQVKSFENLGTLISFGLFLVILAIALIISSILAGKIANSVKHLGGSLSVMASGYLINEITSNSKDEIGTLSRQMNVFQDNLKESIIKIKNHSIKNQKIKDYLVNTAQNASTSSVEISANISSVEKQIIALNSNILESSNQVNEITDFMNDLNSHISDQMAMVEESTASITQMIASISSVSNLTDRNLNVMSNLQNTAREGDHQINETSDAIEEINSSVQKIGEMAQIIQSISDQTNLLAMNAAIEAAHAGDAGKGFAVVADEIRKLSEATAISSNDIARNLKDIITMFQKASTSGLKTKNSFGVIYESIKNVSNALSEITSSTAELNTGGTQILEAMEQLREISSIVQNKSISMKTNGISVKNSMYEVSNISSSVTNAMSEVNIGFIDVKNSISGLEKTSFDIDQITTDLNQEVQKFKTE